MTAPQSLKERILSDFMRDPVIDSVGQTVQLNLSNSIYIQLNLYEGKLHSVQAIAGLPESELALRMIAPLLDEHREN